MSVPVLIEDAKKQIELLEESDDRNWFDKIFGPDTELDKQIEQWENYQEKMEDYQINYQIYLKSYNCEA